MLCAPAFSRHPLVRAVALGLILATLSGCGFFRGAALLWGPEPTRKVPAKYPYLADKKICILVWAEPYTLFEYRWVQLDVSEHVRVAMEGTVPGATFVPNRQVVEYQDQHPNWDKEDPAELGARFAADRVLLIELTQYTTREPESPHLYRGRIGANVKVYDTAHPGHKPCDECSLEVAYPPDSVGEYGTDDRTIRRATMQAFASQLAGRFYDRQETVK